MQIESRERTKYKITGMVRSKWRAEGIGSSFVLELLPSPSSRNGAPVDDVAGGRTGAPQFVHDVGIAAAAFALSSSKYKHNSFNSKLSRINSCCLSSN